MDLKNFDLFKPRQKETAITLPSLNIESSDGKTAKVIVYRLQDGTFQAIINANGREVIGVSADDAESAAELALNQLDQISEQKDPVWTLKYKGVGDTKK